MEIANWHGVCQGHWAIIFLSIRYVPYSSLLFRSISSLTRKQQLQQLPYKMLRLTMCSRRYGHYWGSLAYHHDFWPPLKDIKQSMTRNRFNYREDYLIPHDLLFLHVQLLHECQSPSDHCRLKNNNETKENSVERSIIFSIVDFRGRTNAKFDIGIFLKNVRQNAD